MERKVAVKRLAKMLGKKFGYQIDPKAPSREERAAAKAELSPAMKKRDEIGKQLSARRDAILSADPEYRQLSAEHKAARDYVDKLTGTIYRHKISVGTSNSLFFHVEASGDSWEEIFEVLAKKKKTAA